MAHETACHAHTHSHTHIGSNTSKYKHVQVHKHTLVFLLHTQKHIRQRAALRTAAQLGSSSEEAALQWRSSQTPD